jgi:hypothetical protein
MRRLSTRLAGAGLERRVGPRPRRAVDDLDHLVARLRLGVQRREHAAVRGDGDVAGRGRQVRDELQRVRGQARRAGAVGKVRAAAVADAQRHEQHDDDEAEDAEDPAEHASDEADHAIP